LNVVLIRSMNLSSELRLSERRFAPDKPDFSRFRATISASGMSASADVDAYFSSPLPDFFDELAAKSADRGTVVSWSAHLGELSMTASFEESGMCKLDVFLDLNDEDYGWKLVGSLRIESGDLVPLAAEVRAWWSHAVA
jgi:hypothetical protein